MDPSELLSPLGPCPVPGVQEAVLGPASLSPPCWLCDLGPVVGPLEFQFPSLGEEGVTAPFFIKIRLTDTPKFLPSVPGTKEAISQ